MVVTYTIRNVRLSEYLVFAFWYRHKIESSIIDLVSIEDVEYDRPHLKKDVKRLYRLSNRYFKEGERLNHRICKVECSLEGIAQDACGNNYHGTMNDEQVESFDSLQSIRHTLNILLRESKSEFMSMVKKLDQSCSADMKFRLNSKLSIDGSLLFIEMFGKPLFRMFESTRVRLDTHDLYKKIAEQSSRVNSTKRKSKSRLYEIKMDFDRVRFMPSLYSIYSLYMYAVTERQCAENINCVGRLLTFLLTLSAEDREIRDIIFK